jgi:hypothetical protein
MSLRDRELTDLCMYVLTLIVVVVRLKPKIIGSVQTASE